MSKYNIPNKDLKSLYSSFNNCAYCSKKLIFPYDKENRKDSATIEHLNFEGPFYWDNGLKIEDLVIVCSSCNSSRGTKEIPIWFESKYCKINSINIDTVHENVKLYLDRKYINGEYIYNK